MRRPRILAPHLCDHARCAVPAVVGCTFGDGTVGMPGYEKRQSFAYYCAPHFALVDCMFRLHDVRNVQPFPGCNDRPDGLLRHAA